MYKSDAFFPFLRASGTIARALYFTMKDRFKREINYLRISLTDRCNFRCVYCMPKEGAIFMPQENLLSSQQIQRLIRIAGASGITKFRFTGGEPLLRPDLDEMIFCAAQLPTTQDISMTINCPYFDSILDLAAATERNIGSGRVPSRVR